MIDASEDPAIQAVMDWCMSDPGGLRDVAGRPRHGQAAPGDGGALVGQRETVLDAVLADLEELPSREHMRSICRTRTCSPRRRTRR